MHSRGGCGSTLEQQLFDLKLTKRQLRLGAQADGALVAERAAGNAAGEAAKEFSHA
jgi:hypothetical protein